mmetsp:Transcript_41930/g.65412  ORF Transcript_41930/g.65412 Transcript_41930/m.65412 type:complete len:594 (+) Transcript_41930:112-1893(+)
MDELRPKEQPVAATELATQRPLEAVKWEVVFRRIPSRPSVELWNSLVIYLEKNEIYDPAELASIENVQEVLDDIDHNTKDFLNLLIEVVELRKHDEAAEKAAREKVAREAAERVAAEKKARTEAERDTADKAAIEEAYPKSLKKGDRVQSKENVPDFDVNKGDELEIEEIYPLDAKFQKAGMVLVKKGQDRIMMHPRDLEKLELEDKAWWKSDKCIVISVILVIGVVLMVIIAIFHPRDPDEQTTTPVPPETAPTTTNMPTTTSMPTMPPVVTGPCTAPQIQQGCAPNFCSRSGTCTCLPNRRQDGNRCKKAGDSQLMHFYMYVLSGDDDDRIPNTNDTDIGSVAYSLQGVMWHLHNNIVTKSCPRNKGIRKIQRMKAAVYNTDRPFDTWLGQFGQFANYVNGRCERPDCTSIYAQYGFNVGCSIWESFMGGTSYGNTTHRYSLPGDPKLIGKVGHCASPDSSPHCTWNWEPAGEVKLEELANISDYHAFCTLQGVEYDPTLDRGKGCSFWDNRNSSVAKEKRLAKLQELFLKKSVGSALPEPMCDSQDSAMCRHHPKCSHLGRVGGSLRCCPADNGMMLECCNEFSAASLHF